MRSKEIHKIVIRPRLIEFFESLIERLSVPDNEHPIIDPKLQVADTDAYKRDNYPALASVRALFLVGRSSIRKIVKKMRVLVLVLAALAVSCDAYKNNLVLGEPVSGITQEEGGQLVGFLEKMKNWMKKGNTKPAIPVLDPLKRDHLELNVDDNEIGVTLEAELDNLRSTGLSEFVVKKGDFQFAGLHANIELEWKEFDFFTMYKIIKGKIPPQMALYGEGAIIAIVRNLQVAVDMNLSVNSDNNLYVRKIDLKAQLGEFDFNASGLLNDEELSKVLSKIISELVPQILKDFPTEVSKKGGELLKKALDQVLSKLTFGDLIDIIGS